MANGADISAQIAVDGESQFRDSLKAIDSELKALNAEMQSAVAEFNSLDDAEKSTAEQSKILNDAIDKQKEKLSLLQTQFERETAELDRLGDALEKAKQEFGENSTEAGKAQNAYNRQVTEVQKLRKQMADTKTTIADTSSRLRDIGTAGKAAADGFDKAKKSSSTFKDTLKGVLGANVIMAGVGAAINGLKNDIKAFANGIADVAKYGDEIDKQSQKLRVSTEEYQKLSFAAERSGTSIETLGTAQKALASTDFKGNLTDAINYVAGIADESERAAVATELFGKKAGQEMLPLLNSGADGVKALYDEFDALGGAMSEEAVKAAAEFEDALTNLQTAAGVVKNNMMGEFLPGITTVMQGIVEVIKGNTDEGKEMIEAGFDDIQQKIADFTTNVAEHAPELVEIGISLLLSLIKGIVSSLPTLLKQAPAIISTLVGGVKDLLYIVLDLGRQLLDVLINGLKQGLSNIKQIGVNIVDGLWEGMKSRFADLKSKVTGFCGSIKDVICDAFNINSPSRWMRDNVGVMISRGLADGITLGGRYALTSMTDLGDKLKGATPSIVSPIDMQMGANATLAEGLVNGLSAVGGSNPINLVAQIVMPNGQVLAETVFNDLINVSRQRGVALG